MIQKRRTTKRHAPLPRHVRNDIREGWAMMGLIAAIALVIAVMSYYGIGK
jgi:hypothetical protein